MLLAVWMARAPLADPAHRARRLLSSPMTLVLAGAAYLFSLLHRDPEFRETFRYSVQALAAAAVIAYGFWARAGVIERGFRAVCGWRPVRVIGLASYSIYLAHFCLYHALWALGLPEDARWTVPLLVVAGLGGGIALWRLVEQPVLAWRQRRDAVALATS